MINLLAHITEVEAPTGVVLFLAGMLLGGALVALVKRWRLG